MDNRVILQWSGGKDAALSLYKLQQENTIVSGLITTINERLNRITMHGVRHELLVEQVKALGLELEILPLPESINMKKYDAIMHQVQDKHTLDGITHYAYGDIFLEDLKKYRDDSLSKTGLSGIYPLWGKNTLEVIQEFIGLGFKAIVVAVSSKVLDKSFVGRTIDASFINDLPENVDPCGENGEFHTFVYDGPNFKYPVDFTLGERTYKTYNPASQDDSCFCDNEQDTNWDKGFWFIDLKLKNA